MRAFCKLTSTTDLRVVHVVDFDARQPFIPEVGPAVEVDCRDDLHVRYAVVPRTRERAAQYT